MENLLALFFILLPFILIIYISIIRAKKKFKKEELEMSKLPPELQEQKKKKNEEQVINAFTVILPMAIFITLKNSLNIGEAFIISVVVGIIFRQIFNLLQRKRSKSK